MESEKAAKTNYHKSATMSWAIFFIFVFLRYVSRNSMTATSQSDAKILAWTMVIMGIAFYLIGILAGVYALSGIKKAGRKGILIPAIIGITLNSLALTYTAILFLIS